MLGADTRSTSDLMVSAKNCDKIHYIARNIFTCGAGTAADTEKVTSFISSNLALLRYETDFYPRVVAATTLLKAHLFRHRGVVSAALVIGGVDSKGPHLATIFPDGAMDSLPFCSMGSGSLNAISVLESNYRENMALNEAIKLVSRAIRSGMYNDLFSGNNIDISVITKTKTEILRNLVNPNIESYSHIKKIIKSLDIIPELREKLIPLYESKILQK